MVCENYFYLGGRVREVRDLDKAEATVNLVVSFDSAGAECDTQSFFIKMLSDEAQNILRGDDVSIKGHIELRREWRTGDDGGRIPGRRHLVLRGDEVTFFE